MLLERLEDLTESARSVLTQRWTRDAEYLVDARIGLSVCFELFEADLSEEPLWYQHWYERASPRRRFQIFLSAMKLPEFGDSTEDVLTGLSRDELELVWLAVHLDYMALGDAEREEARLSDWNAVSFRNIQMIVMHLLTRSIASS